MDCTPFSRQEYWSGLPFPSPGHLPDPGIEPGSPALQADSLPSEPPRKPKQWVRVKISTGSYQRISHFSSQIWNACHELIISFEVFQVSAWAPDTDVLQPVTAVYSSFRMQNHTQDPAVSCCVHINSIEPIS